MLGEQSEDLAATLLERFGSIAGIISASPDTLRSALCDNPAVADAVIACRELIRISSLEQLVGEPVSVGCKHLRDYLIAELQNVSEERLQAIYLDRDRRYIRDERISQGSRQGLSLRLRYLVHRALDLGASGLIIAHNHPSGSALPSPHDHETTERLHLITAQLEIELVDHCIIAGGRVFSMALGKHI